jgi:hypothetical protein
MPIPTRRRKGFDVVVEIGGDGKYNNTLNHSRVPKCNGVPTIDLFSVSGRGRRVGGLGLAVAGTPGTLRSLSTRPRCPTSRSSVVADHRSSLSLFSLALLSRSSISLSCKFIERSSSPPTTGRLDTDTILGSNPEPRVFEKSLRHGGRSRTNDLSNHRLLVC